MKTKLSDYEHLLSADYRIYDYIKDESRYYEVKKDGTIEKHEKMSWATPETKFSI